ncbi:MAG TPA: response regulator transcription factor [Chloroflexota bacterium]|nr:response regulator transcription factor [Chloroflexota bacterium]
MSTPIRILITDDDPDLLFTLQMQLESDGYTVLSAPNGLVALTLAEKGLPHLAILDLAMPIMDGFELARRLKRLGDVPIIMLTAMDDEESKVKGLELYAEDYVTKPFSYRELKARIRRILERAWPGGEPEASNLQLDDDLEIDFSRRQVVRAGMESVRLTPTETRLLQLLSRNMGRILPNALLLDRAWPDGGGSAQALWEYIRRLRQKLGDDPEAPRYLESERGIGYRLRRVTPKEPTSSE